jgi:hypothetical protein
MTHKAVFLALVVIGLLAACTDTRRSLGDDCLKNQDCLSGICSEYVCTAPPPLLDAMVDNADATPVEETGPGEGAAPEGGAAEAAAEAGAETGGGDAAADGAAD